MIPFLPLLMKAAPAIGSLLGKMAGSRGDAQVKNETLGVTRAAGMNRDTLARDQFAVQAPGARLASSARASMLGSAQPAKTNWGGPGSGLRGEIPTTSGGFAGGLANMDPGTKQLSQQVIKDQLLGQMQGGKSAPGGGTDSAITPYPEIGKSSGFDKVLGAAGSGFSLLGLLKQFMGGGQQQILDGEGQ